MKYEVAKITIEVNAGEVSKVIIDGGKIKEIEVIEYIDSEEDDADYDADGNAYILYKIEGEQS